MHTGLEVVRPLEQNFDREDREEHVVRDFELRPEVLGHVLVGLHADGDRVDDDHEEDHVLEEVPLDEPPEDALERVPRDVALLDVDHVVDRNHLGRRVQHPVVGGRGHLTPKYNHRNTIYTTKYCVVRYTGRLGETRGTRSCAKNTSGAVGTHGKKASEKRGICVCGGGHDVNGPSRPRRAP